MQHPPLARARIRDALGYKAWTPSIADPPTTLPIAAPEALARADTVAIASSRGMASIDRVLHWLNPARIRDAVKARLR